MNFAARRPMPIPNGHAPVMEKNSSQSPVDLPTPPDDVTLSENASIVRNDIMYGTRKNPLLYTPAYRAELPRYTPMSYPNTRSYGVGLSSAFQLSAERQNVSPAATEDASLTTTCLWTTFSLSQIRQITADREQLMCRAWGSTT